MKQLHKRILKNISIDSFVKSLSDICATYSETAVHKLKGKVYSAKEMKQMIEKNNDNLDELELIIIQVLFEKLDLYVEGNFYRVSYH